MLAPDWVFLDLDNTLWDFDGNAEEALGELFHRHHLHVKSNYSVEHFVALYKTINAGYWKQYEKGEIQKDFLRTARFTDTFNQMGIPASEHPEDIWEEYLQICPMMTRMIPGAHLLLEVIAQNAKIAIITNGFAQTQSVKIRESRIEKYIQFMLTSEAAGCAKPDPAIFNHALVDARVAADKCIYIGDTLATDIEGGIAAGLKVLWYNPSNTVVPENIKNNPLYLGQFQSLVEMLAFMGEKWNWV